MMRTTLLIVIFLVVPLRQTLSQLASQEGTFRLAQSNEQSGNFEKAAELYRQLNNIDPANYLFFDGLRRSYLQLKQYDNCILLMKNRLSLNTKDVNLHAMLGSVQYKAGLEKEASASWQNAIGVDPLNQNVYRIVANSILENRLLEKAASVYEKARTVLNDDNLFTIDIAYLLSVSMDFSGATKEYSRWVKINPTQMGFVQGRMAQYTGKPEGREAAIAVLQDELKTEEHLQTYELLGWVLLEGKEFGRTFEVYKTIDRLTNARGVQIHAFADRCFNEEAYAVAAKAYQHVIDLPVDGVRLPAAKYGYANCLVRLSAETDTLSLRIVSSARRSESQPLYDGAVAYFQSIVKEYPRTEYSARSYYQIGMLQYERYFDLDAALASFENVKRELPVFPVLHYDVGLKIGGILLAKGDTAGARQQFLPIVGAHDAAPDQADEAGFHLAEISYFSGKFDQAIDRLSEISFDLKANYANDALALLAFLQENALGDRDALEQYARADFLARQRRNSVAIPLFLDIISRFPQALLVDDALMKVAALQDQAGMHEEAIRSFERLIREFQETSIALDKAQFSIGQIYERSLGNPTMAIKTYEDLLTNHPQSLLCVEARKRIRLLRGDAL